MLTSKQRAQLRAMASTADTIVQIGKGGITENVITQVKDALKARELIKGRVLENSMLTAREAYALINQPSPLPGGTYSFCYDVLDLWGAKPVDRNSSANLVFMLSSVFAAGMEYANREGGAAGADRNV